MIKSTNQVAQFYVVNDTATPVIVGEDKFKIRIDNEDETDVVDQRAYLGYTEALPTADSEKLALKGLLVKLSADVNGGAPVAGQDYIITLRFRGNIGEEDTVEKVAMAHATASDTAVTLLQKLAQSLIDNAGEYALYDIYDKDAAAKITDVTTITADGFMVVEAKPYWRLGTFQESLAKIDVSTRPITVSGDDVVDWLDSYKLVKTAITLPNTHKVADMEYFYKGERGVSAYLNAPYDLQLPVKLKVDPDNATGYYLLTIHYAYIGANASNQKSEKDIILATTDSTKLATIKTLLDALTEIA